MIHEEMLKYVFDHIRPQLQADGGDAEITKLDHDSGTVYVSLKGACVGCPMSAITLSQGIEKVLVENVPGVEHVKPDLDAMEGFADEEVDVQVVDDDGNIVGTKKVSTSELLNGEIVEDGK